VEPDGITFRRWQDGDAIGFTKLVPEFRDTYEAPYYVVHRAHFHEALHQLAQKLGVTIRLRAKVTGFSEHEPSVALADGSIVAAELVIAADGNS
jgi:salicylate hydroxylase